MYVDNDFLNIHKSNFKIYYFQPKILKKKT